jgi:ribonuclease BN (tRNA processing enzyme)
MKQGKTVNIGSFRVAPIELHHDVPNSGFLIYHDACGTILFALDTYKLDFNIMGIDHWIIEANYDDRILKANVEDRKIDRAQANRLMLSHMSIENTVRFLRDCEAEKSKTITLCHLSERNSDPEMFRKTVAGAFGVPCYCATKGLVVELSKDML